FASAWVYPVIDDTIEIEIPESDVRVDTYRSSGAGGQRVNPTDSAVRLTHIPTGIAVACQAGRSQHQHRATRRNILRGRIDEEDGRRRGEAARATGATATDTGWRYQIRTCVPQPSQLVKDLQTGVESTNPAPVLGGDNDAIVGASLA